MCVVNSEAVRKTSGPFEGGTVIVKRTKVPKGHS
uniref:Uncharacterized protein n=1 Tax=Anguilla anguilla TaxID=7936 RepID=A0A0E9SDD9_ANGAN